MDVQLFGTSLCYVPSITKTISRYFAADSFTKRLMKGYMYLLTTCTTSAIAGGVTATIVGAPSSSGRFAGFLAGLAVISGAGTYFCTSDLDASCTKPFTKAFFGFASVVSGVAWAAGLEAAVLTAVLISLGSQGYFFCKEKHNNSIPGYTVAIFGADLAVGGIFSALLALKTSFYSAFGGGLVATVIFNSVARYILPGSSDCYFEAVDNARFHHEFVMITCQKEDGSKKYFTLEKMSYAIVIQIASNKEPIKHKIGNEKRKKVVCIPLEENESKENRR